MTRTWRHRRLPHHVTDSLNQIKSAFRRGMSSLGAGDAAAAERHAREALAAFPDDGNLLCLLGAALVRQRRPADAERPLRRAVNRYPRFVRAHDELGGALLVQGRFADAVEVLERARALEPRNASVLMKLGRALARLGRAGEADEAFELAFRQTPHRFELARAAELFAKGERLRAEQLCRRVLNQDPNNVDALRFLAEIAARRRQWGEAEKMLQRAVDVAPEFLPAWHALIGVYREQDEYEKCLAAADAVLERDPANPNMLCERANVSTLAGRHDEAIATYRQALELAPSHAGSLAGLGHALKTVGRTREAIAAYRRCIAAHPAFGEAWWSLANLKTFRFSADELAVMKEQLAGGRLTDESRVHFCFAVAKAYEDLRRYPRAFEFYARGNRARRMMESYDPVQTEIVNDRILATFSRDFFAERWGWGCASAAPIFIVGLPRSGSTLLEQILASHSQVDGTFELPELPRVIRSLNLSRRDDRRYPEAVARLGREECEALGEEYLRRTRKHRGSAARFTA